MLEMLETENILVQVLVVCPTRELTLQTADQIKQLAKYKKWVKILPIIGGQSIDRQFTALKRKPQIVIGTPGRLMDHIEHNRLKLHAIKMVVLDEADEMLSMGFQDDINAIIKKMPKYKQTLMFSATMSKQILKLTTKYQNNPQKIIIAAQQLTVSTIEQFSIQTQEPGKFDALTRIVDGHNLKRNLVFCNTKHKVISLTQNLRMHGYVAEAMHGDIKQGQRSAVLARFKEGKTTMLIATDVAARGIDVQNIDAVINYDFPNDEEYYVHRIGRTGRAGKTGVAYTFITTRDSRKLREIQRYTNAKITPIEPPTKINLEKKIMSELINKATRALKKRKYEDYIEQVQKILDEANASGDEKGTFTATDLSAALLHIITTQPAGRIKPESKPTKYSKPNKTYQPKGKSFGGYNKSGRGKKTPNRTNKKNGW